MKKKQYYIYGSFILLIIILLSIGKYRNSTSSKNTGFFEDSFKEQKDKNQIEIDTEYFDSTTNIYSNFKYKIAFDAPNNWSSDAGVSEHTIFRTFEPDSAITFSINVIELKLNEKEKKNPVDAWQVYQANKEKMDYQYKVLIPKQLNTEINDFRAKKTYLKNNIAVRRSFNYMVRELDLEYSNTSIIYQTIVNGLTFTFSFDIPTMFYDEKPEFYEDIFRNIYFLANKDELNKLINKK
ncbi:hypothetical protein ACW5R3_12215 [Bizionia sp. KMM 8389]